MTADGRNSFVRFALKWLGVIFAMFVVVEISFSQISSARFRERYYQLYQNEQEERLNYLYKNLCEQFREIVRVSSLVYRDPVVSDIYVSYNHLNSHEKDQLLRHLETECLRLINENHLLNDVCFYFPEQQLVIDEDGYDFSRSIELPGHLQPGQNISFKENEILLSQVTFGDSPVNNRPISVMMVSVDLNELVQELDYSRFTAEDIIILTGIGGDSCSYIYDGQEFRSAQTEPEINTKDYFSYIKESDPTIHLTYYLCKKPLMLIEKGSRADHRWMMVTVIGAIITVFFIFYKSLIKPLEKLLNTAFGKINNEEFSYRIPIDNSQNEVFKALYLSFNRMVEKLDLLVTKEMKQEILINQEAYRHLQAQINTHFIYNSYFLLYRFIRKKDWENSLYICKSLGNLFKYITRDAETDKLLKDEINYARTYTSIQKYRFEERIDVRFDELPEQYTYIFVPRIVIQPILENIFKYAYAALDENEILKICVSYFERDGYLYIRIENSGHISDEDVEKLDKRLTDSKGKEVTSLVNISNRMDIYFHTSKSLQVSRSELGGLCVTMRIPL